MSKEGRLITAFETHLVTEKRVANNTFLAYKRDIDQFLKFLHTKKQTIETCNKCHFTTTTKKVIPEDKKAMKNFNIRNHNYVLTN